MTKTTVDGRSVGGASWQFWSWFAVLLAGILTMTVGGADRSHWPGMVAGGFVGGGCPPAVEQFPFGPARDELGQVRSALFQLGGIDLHQLADQQAGGPAIGDQVVQNQ